MSTNTIISTVLYCTLLVSFVVIKTEMDMKSNIGVVFINFNGSINLL